MSTNPQNGAQPTVVLVHGAFADGSSWYGVIEQLEAAGVAGGVAPPNPLRSIAPRRRVYRQLYQPDPRPGAPRRPFVWRCGYHERRIPGRQRRGPRLRGRFCPGRRRNPAGAPASNSKDSLVLPALIPLQYPTGNGTGDRKRVHHRPRQGARGLCRRPPDGKPGQPCWPPRSVRLPK